MTDETIGNVPILILGNKIDRPEAISEESLREMFGLYGQTTGKVSRLRTLSGQCIIPFSGQASTLLQIIKETLFTHQMMMINKIVQSSKS